MSGFFSGMRVSGCLVNRGGGEDDIECDISLKIWVFYNLITDMRSKQDENWSKKNNGKLEERQTSFTCLAVFVNVIDKSKLRVYVWDYLACSVRLIAN